MAMRIKAAVLFVLAGMILCLSGCSPKTKELTEADIENAKTVFDVTSLMIDSENAMIYSECKDDKDLYIYFDLLNTDEYIKVNHKGQDYLLLWYTYYSYTDKVTDACSVSKSFHGKELKVTVTVDKEELGEGIEGCFPTQSRVRLILKLENDVNIINVGNRLFSKFNGGRRRIFKKDCVVDQDLNFILPPIYDGIMDLEPFQANGCPTLYRFYRDQMNGVMDSNYKIILDNKYGNIYYINENKFIVGISDEDPKNDEIAIVDAKGNIIKKMKGCLKAQDSIHLYTAEGHIQICDPSTGDIWGEGIIDTDLNVILEPIYDQIIWHRTYYKTVDLEGRKANFKADGRPA